VPDPVSPLAVQFLEWLSAAPRSYPDVMEAWRTSCPRLSTWEDTVNEGLVELLGGREQHVVLTARGRAFLQQHRRKDGASTASR
jgi:hypothetical protein